MDNYRVRQTRILAPWLGWLVLVALLLGIAFRFINLDRKVYWHDEVYTSMRAAGFTRHGIDQEIFQNQVIPASELQKFQRIKPGSTTVDTIYSLAVEDPQHPPLYFLMARGWMQSFGSSLTASRSLPTLLSLLGLPVMYALGMELFASPWGAWLATALFALSPFDILFAQTARQYSLLTMITIASSWLLLRAIRLGSWQSWGMYAIACTIGLYTHPFFGLTLIAQSAYIGGLLLLGIGGSKWMGTMRRRAIRKTMVFSYGGALAIALLLYSPWIAVLITNLQRASSTTNWTKASVGLDFLLKLWTLSFSALFVDLDVGFNNPWTYAIRIPVVLIILVSLYSLCRRTPHSTWLFVLTSVLIPFLLLALPDLILGGKRSAVSRYLIPCFPAIQLAVGYWFFLQLRDGHRFWRGALVLLLTGSIVSCTVSALDTSWWNKDLSYFNARIADAINATPAPVLISDIGNDFTNTGDLISLSYRLKDQVNLFLVSQPADLTPLNNLASTTDLFVFRPSGELRNAFTANRWQLEPLPDDLSNIWSLWRLRRLSN